jgi:hypothetical protein
VGWCSCALEDGTVLGVEEGTTVLDGSGGEENLERRGVLADGSGGDEGG